MTVSRRTTVVTAAALSAILALAACNGAEPVVGPTGSSSSTSAKITTAPPTTTTTSKANTTTPTPTVDPVLAKIPKAARPETIEGAGAFVEFYFEQLNRGLAEADPTLVQGLYLDSCMTCVKLAKDTLQLKSDELRHDGDTLEVTLSTATVFDEKNRQVLVRFNQFAVPVVNKVGQQVDKTKAGEGEFVAILEFKGHWRLKDLGRPR